MHLLILISQVLKSFESKLVWTALTYSTSGKFTVLQNPTMTTPACVAPNSESRLFIHVSQPLTPILSKVINIEVLLPHSHVTIQPGPIPFRAAWCHGNRGNAWSLFNKRCRTRAMIPYWPLRTRLNAGDISEVEFAISTNMRASSSPAWQHIKSIQITWIPNTLIHVSGGMHYN